MEKYFSIRERLGGNNVLDSTQGFKNEVCYMPSMHPSLDLGL